MTARLGVNVRSDCGSTRAIAPRIEADWSSLAGLVSSGCLSCVTNNLSNERKAMEGVAPAEPRGAYQLHGSAGASPSRMIELHRAFVENLRFAHARRPQNQPARRIVHMHDAIRPSGCVPLEDCLHRLHRGDDLP